MATWRERTMQEMAEQLLEGQVLISAVDRKRLALAEALPLIRQAIQRAEAAHRRLALVAIEGQQADRPKAA